MINVLAGNATPHYELWIISIRHFWSVQFFNSLVFTDSVAMVRARSIVKWMKDPNDDTQTAEDCSVEMCQSYRTRQEHVMRYEKFDWSRYSAFGATVLENFVFLINRAIVSFCFRLLFSFLIPINNELHDTLIICLTMWVWALGQHVQYLWFS